MPQVVQKNLMDSPFPQTAMIMGTQHKEEGVSKFVHAMTQLMSQRVDDLCEAFRESWRPPKGVIVTILTE